jgi:hypothetical protein
MWVAHLVTACVLLAAADAAALVSGPFSGRCPRLRHIPAGASDGSVNDCTASLIENDAVVLACVASQTPAHHLNVQALSLQHQQ